MEMTRRERFADWISGGALTKARDELHISREAHKGTCKKLADWARMAVNKQRALDDIIGMETANCASIGKRMAKRAQEGRK